MHPVSYPKSPSSSPELSNHPLLVPPSHRGDARSVNCFFASHKIPTRLFSGSTLTQTGGDSRTSISGKEKFKPNQRVAEAVL
jgi:hypothetical protein